ncbi:hypothetical protein AAFC00_003675 [Neodothiora populina]|uniref:N-acetyltransferase domain-containing protein n=1 Tax=Neodothiora populina TaxID=2781224 RepID=A0ABR3PF84_9PEZI
MQSSLLTWLKKPDSVKQAPSVSPTSSQPEEDTTRLSTPRKPAWDGLPTPPPEEARDCHKKEEEHDISRNTKSTSSSTSNLTQKYAPSPLIPNLTLVPCTKPRLQDFKRLNSLLLQIPYPAKFYDEIISDPIVASITLLAVWTDDPDSASSSPGRVVGGIRCRLLTSESSSPFLYISTLVVLSAYRTYGIATHLLSSVTSHAIKHHRVRSVGAHVWTANEEGRAWYAKRGFREQSTEEGYYRRLEPSSAVVVRREVSVGDLLGS